MRMTVLNINIAEGEIGHEAITHCKQERLRFKGSVNKSTSSPKIERIESRIDPHLTFCFKQVLNSIA